MARYTVTWAEMAKAERRELRAFIRPALETAVRLRVGQYRVLYSVEGDMVRVLRVILKGRRTLGETL
jgi:mRNA-degrading endonuclease RelE of RelBE toxin-antitoxin system